MKPAKGRRGGREGQKTASWTVEFCWGSAGLSSNPLCDGPPDRRPTLLVPPLPRSGRNSDLIMRSVKLISIGENAVGKTSMLIAYTSNTFPNEYIPTVFDEYSAVANFGGVPISFGLWDSAASREYDALRPLSYPQTDAFILIYSVVEPDSFAAIETRWIPEITAHAPNVPFVLVGSKTDLRTDFNTLEYLLTQDRGLITTEEGHELAQRIGAHCYMEVSSIRLEGLRDLFNEVVLLAAGLTQGTQKRANRMQKCTIL